MNLPPFSGKNQTPANFPKKRQTNEISGKANITNFHENRRPSQIPEIFQKNHVPKMTILEKQ